MNNVIIWLDDFRNPFEYIDYPNIVWLSNYNQFTNWIELNGLPFKIYFDHDLGEEKTGYDCAKYLIEYCLDGNLKLPLYEIQSANPVGKVNIDTLFKNYIKQSQKE